MTFTSVDVVPAKTFNRHGCTLRRVNAQDIPDAVVTRIEWDTLDHATADMWDRYDPSIVTIPETGLWAITIEISRNGGVNARSYFEIVPDGGVFSTTVGSIRNPFISGEDQCSLTAVTPFTAGDTFHVHVFADGTAASTMFGVLTCYRLTGGAA